MKVGCLLCLCSAVLLLLFSVPLSTSEDSGASRPGSALMIVDNKYRNSSPLQLEEILFGMNAADHDNTHLPDIGCHFDVAIRWIADIGSRGYGTPLIDDVFGEERQIVVAGLENFVEILYGTDGDKAKNWPFSLTSTMVASPLLFDIDSDGVDELLITTKDGDFVFLRTDALQVVAGKTLKVPPLQVARDWYLTVDEKKNPVDLGAQQAAQKEAPANKKQSAPSSGEAAKKASGGGGGGRRNLFSRQDADDEEEIDSGDTKKKMKNMKAKLEELRETKPGMGDFQGWLTDEALESFELFLPTATPGEYIKQLRLSVDPLYSVQYNQWLAEHSSVDAKHLWVDAHVLSTPVIADLDGDGRPELIAGVSYYFDPAKFNDAVMLKTLGANVNIAHYLMCGVTVFDLLSGQLKWSVELDRSTEYTPYHATMSGSPAVADLDGDGRLEIVVGTGVGWLYILNGRDGSLWSPKKGAWPQLVDAVFSSPSIVDLNGDGALDVLVCDSNGNIVAFNAADGDVLWDAHMSGYPVRPASFADINADGVLDVVVGTITGQLWAWAGNTGQLLPNFPVKLAGRVLGQPLLLPWPAESKRSRRATATTPTERQPNTGHVIVVHASDGVLYLVDGTSGCADRVDMGSSSTAMILADDVTGRGQMELVLLSDNRKVALLETNIRYDPRRAWRWEDPSGGGQGASIAPQNQLIVVVHRPREAAGSSAIREIVGTEFRVVFEIIDGRLTAPDSRFRDEYRVRITWGTRQLLAEQMFTRPGLYAIDVTSPQEFRSSAKITVDVHSVKTGVLSRDSFWISINIGFYRTLKWALLLPFLALSIVVFFVASRQRLSVQLSS